MMKLFTLSTILLFSTQQVFSQPTNDECIDATIVPSTIKSFPYIDKIPNFSNATENIFDVASTCFLYSAETIVPNGTAVPIPEGSEIHFANGTGTVPEGNETLFENIFDIISKGFLHTFEGFFPSAETNVPNATVNGTAVPIPEGNETLFANGTVFPIPEGSETFFPMGNETFSPNETVIGSAVPVEMGNETVVPISTFKDVWYSWTPTVTGSYDFSTIGSKAIFPEFEYELVPSVTIFEGSDCGVLEQVTCGYSYVAAVELRAGKKYYIQIMDGAFEDYVANVVFTITKSEV